MKYISLKNICFVCLLISCTLNIVWAKKNLIRAKNIISMEIIHSPTKIGENKIKFYLNSIGSVNWIISLDVPAKKSSTKQYILDALIWAYRNKVPFMAMCESFRGSICTNLASIKFLKHMKQ